MRTVGMILLTYVLDFLGFDISIGMWLGVISLLICNEVSACVREKSHITEESKDKNKEGE